MFDSQDKAAAYRQRAEMHEQLAAATSDEPARKMHQAMAAAYRRKADEAAVDVVMSQSGNRSAMLMVEPTY
ncbi:MAG TPA: hypothetical protein VGE05_05520 [Novosphingobium sp.]